MAVTDLGHAGPSTTTATMTSSAAVTAGTLVVVGVLDNTPANFSTTGVADSVGNTYTLARQAGAGGSFEGAIFYSFITTPLTNTSTIHYTSSGASTVQINASQVPGYNAIDTATTNSANNFTTSNTLNGAGAASVANEIYFAFLANQGTLSSAFGGAWSQSGTSTPNSGDHNLAWQINSGTSALGFTSTLTGSSWITQVIVSFTPAPTVVAAATGVGWAETEW